MLSLAEQLSSFEAETLTVSVTDAVAQIEISRPKALNALSPDLVDELHRLVTLLRDGIGAGSPPDWSVRGVVLTGAGEKSFVAGADIAEMSQMGAAEAERYALKADAITSWLETLAVPTVAAVNGYALGGGCELAMACDVIYASENAVFGQPEVGLGLIPGFGGCVRLQRHVGSQVARDLIFTGRKIDAAEAHRIGLVSQVFPSVEATRQAAHNFVQSVAKQSPVAVANAKATIREVAEVGVDQGLQIEAKRFASCFDTADMREGTAAFVEKRRPDFTGN